MPFTVSKPLCFGDCDLSGIAYHPAYIRMLVEVVEALFASLDAPWNRLMQEERLGVPTVLLNLEFRRPALYGDMLDFAVHVRALGRSSVDFETVVTVRGETVWTASHRLVMTSLADHKSRPWPDRLRQAFTALLESDRERPATGQSGSGPM